MISKEQGRLLVIYGTLRYRLAGLEHAKVGSGGSNQFLVV